MGHRPWLAKGREPNKDKERAPYRKGTLGKGKGKVSIQKGTLGKGFHTDRNPRKGKGKGKGKDSIQKGTLRKEKGREGERERIPYRKEP